MLTLCVVASPKHACSSVHRLKAVLFPGGKEQTDFTTPLTYPVLYDRIKELLERCDVVISKVCHAMRVGGAQLLDALG